MSCLRCGVETENEQVFCDSCRAVMAENPIKPGTPVHIPQRPDREPEKAPNARRVLTPKETIGKMRKLIRWLTAVIGVLTLVICILAGILLFHMNDSSVPDNIGRNYTTTNTTQPG